MFSRDNLFAFGWYLVILSLGVFIPLPLIFWVPESILQNYSPVVGALGAYGTILLAVATFITVRQNRKNIRELRRVREKPLAIDEIQNILDPIVRWTDEDISAYEEHDTNGSFIEWSYIQDPLTYPGRRRPGSLIPVSNPDYTALKRLFRNKPELESKIEERNKLLLNLRKQANDILDLLEPSVINRLNEADIATSDSNIRVLCNSILQQIDEFGENSELYDFWEKHGEALNQLVWDEAGEEYSALLSGEEDFIAIEKEIHEEAKLRKYELKEKYGISSDDLDEEHGGMRS